MQQALRFLEAVLPPGGLRVVASKPPQWSKGLKHQFLETNEEAVRETARLDRAGVTTYIALATYTDPEGGRKAENTAMLQCLWVDLDYKHYESTAAATAAMEDFYRVVGVPSIRVQSGNGMHAYWVLRTPLPTQEWKPLATAFQAAWQSFPEIRKGADPVSADAARILRLPGSHNYKPEYGQPREVVIESMEDLTYDAKSIAARLGAAAPAPVIQRPLALPAAMSANDDLGGGIEHRPAYIKPLVKECRQLRWAFANQGAMSEPQWYATIQLVRHVEDGRRAAHIFSNKHPGYSPEETDAKLDQLERNGIGPTTCARFKQVNPDACAGCQYNVTSPIVLGYERVEDDHQPVARIEAVQDEDGNYVKAEVLAAPDVPTPAGFKVTKAMTYKVLSDPDTKADYDQPIFGGRILPERLVASARQDNTTLIQLYIDAVGKEPQRLTIPGKVLSDKRDLSRELHSKGVFYLAKDASHILEMLSRMVQSVQTQKETAQLAEQMGWQSDDSFVVGATAYRPQQPPLFDLPVPPSTKSVVDNYEPAGSFAEWKKTADIYNRPGGEAYQFALAYGAAGVFLPLTKLSGVVLSLYSQQAGRGKSTAGYAALSWWGQPQGLKSQSKDTNNALFHKASRHKNLPIMMDEITSKDPRELEDLIYYMTQGREKESLTANREARPVLPGWALPAISTSNNSIRAKLQSARGDTQGLFARVIEVQMDLPFAETLPYTDRMALRYGFEDNYGFAGPQLLRYAMNNLDVARSMLDSYMVKLDAAVAGDPAYRFWTASCAATLTVVGCAVRAGLLRYDLPALTDWVVDVLRKQRSDTMLNLSTPEDILGRFLEQNANRLVISYTRNLGGNGTTPAIWPEDGVHGNQLVGRAELPLRSLYISTAAFGRFCHDYGFDLASFVKNASTSADALSSEPLLKQAAPEMVSLGKGTKTASARVKALEFNLMHPCLREFAAGIDQRINHETTHLRSVQ